MIKLNFKLVLGLLITTCISIGVSATSASKNRSTSNKLGSGVFVQPNVSYNAWSLNGFFTPSVTGPGWICDYAQEVYDANNLPSGASNITWSISGYGAQIISSSGTQATVGRDGYGEFTVDVTYTLNGIPYTVSSSTVQGGMPHYIVVSGEVYNDGQGAASGTLCSNPFNYDNYYNVVTYQLNDVPSTAYPLTLNWGVYGSNGLLTNGNFLIYSGSGSFTVPGYSPGSGYSVIMTVSGGPCNEPSSDYYEISFDYVDCN